MGNQSKLKVLVLAAALMSASGMAHAAFTVGMDKEQVAIEIGAQLKSGASLTKIARLAKEAGLNAAELTTALIQAGQVPAAVAQAVAKVNPDEADSVTQAAIAAAPDQRKAITAAVLTAPGVNPATVLSATAAGSPDRAVALHAPFIPVATPVSSGGGHQASPS